MKQDYIYAVARIRSRELSLLNRQDIDQLLSCKTCEECLRVLSDKGWGNGASSPEAVLTAEGEQTWELIRELTDDLTPFDVLLFPIDYNNLKAAVKTVVTGTEPVNVFLPGGTVDPEIMMRCARENDFSPLPLLMAEAAQDAYTTLLQTGDGQLCDVILDRSCLLSILDEGNKSKNRLLKEYAELTAATADIKIAVRACKTGKTRAFLNAALAPCGTLDVSELTIAACKGLEDLYAFLSSTPYDRAVEELKTSYSAFEKWCDDKIMELIRGERSEHFTVGPLFAYVLARQNEIGTVRIILSGKLNELDESMIRERLREMYV